MSSWAVIDVDKGEVVWLTDTKKEAIKEVREREWIDMLSVRYSDQDCVHKYIIEKENDI